jgi:hypothetical protein
LRVGIEGYPGVVEDARYLIVFGVGILEPLRLVLARLLQLAGDGLILVLD